MDIRTLTYFLVVAREKNITRAAKKLHMTQPPLSRQMRELEQEIGKPLFIRHSRSIELTEEGRLLRQRAVQIVDLMEKTERELQGVNEIQGIVRIGCAESQGMDAIAQILASLRLSFPNIHYKLYSKDADRVLDQLDAGAIDFGFVIGEVDIQNYEYRLLRSSAQWGVYVRYGHDLAAKDFILPKDLSAFPLILSRQTTNNSAFFSWIGKDMKDLDIVMTYDLIYNASWFAIHGFGVLVGLEGILSRNDLKFIPFSPISKAPLWLVWNKGQLFSKASQTVLNQIKRSCIP
ncbi:hypothetical protein C815_00340 [Firmicutes bacterium M10-2]|nr:hypothetical protein C815_00340 [Firmicutes bacterium M10-2]